MSLLPDPSIILARVAAKREHDRKIQAALIRILEGLQEATKEGLPPYAVPFPEKDFTPEEKLSLVQQVLDEQNRHFTTGEYVISSRTKKEMVYVDVQAL